jgi:tellurite resistance-related uncharacterized protein
VERRIVAFFNDDAGDWVARLDCLHRQHVRHNPPFRCASWVLDDDARSWHVGTALDCPLCDRAELPPDLEVIRVTDTWDEQTMPQGLRRAHRIASGTWARLRVEAGALRFRAQTDPAIDVVLGVDASQTIPPTVLHEVEPCGSVRFFVEFLGPGSRR